MAMELDPQAMLEVEKGLRLCTEADELCRRARNCGYDTTGQELMCRALRERLDAVKREFGPGRRD